ncbi:MAG: hypothetical protein U0169_02260 [Polyangiaceae bacterium]
MTPSVGDALVDLLDVGWPEVSAKARELLATVADVFRPDPPITLRTLEGHALTGLAVMDRGQVIAFLGSRHPGAVPAPHGHPRYPYGDDDELPWTGSPAPRWR